MATKPNRSPMFCELFILRKHGMERTSEQWEAKAELLGWNPTDLYTVGKMLESEGFHSRRNFHATFADIQTALQEGCDVIAVVDNKEMTTDVKVLNNEYILDEHFGPTPNHAVVIEEYDPEQARLTLWDPAKGRYTFSRTLFKQAWDDSSNFLIKVRQEPFDK